MSEMGHENGRGKRRGVWPLVALLLLVTSAEAAAACRVAVLGDSLTAGYGVQLQDAFPTRLETALDDAGYSCTVINAGVSGDTSAGGLARIDWLLADDPTHMIVELGGNDGLRALPTEALRANLAGIIDKAQAQGVEVMLSGMEAPPNMGGTYTGAFRAVFADLAAEKDVPLDPFFLDGAIQDPSLMQPDGIHPNPNGVRVIVDRLLPFVTAWLQSTGIEPRGAG